MKVLHEKTTWILLLVLLLSPVLSMAQKNPRNLEIGWKTDTNKHMVPLEEFTILLLRDGIPPIDTPGFWEAKKAVSIYFEHEPVIAVQINNEAKAYPLSILMFHEIVNDELGNTPISATYCPLCNAALVFDRRLQHEGTTYLLDFGVSGMLRNSDLVMWDRQTESWWQQFTGEALVGELAGTSLNLVSSQLISVGEFFENYPEGKMLSAETGHSREYGTNPYSNYDDPDNIPRFYKGEIDNRLPPMERVIDIQVKGRRKIYPLSAIQKLKVINDVFEGEPIVLFHTSRTISVMDAGQINESREVGSTTVFSAILKGEKLQFENTNEGRFKDKISGSVFTITGYCMNGKYKGLQLEPVRHGNHFAFAWFAFYADSEIFQYPE